MYPIVFNQLVQPLGFGWVSGIILALTIHANELRDDPHYRFHDVRSVHRTGSGNENPNKTDRSTTTIAERSVA